MSLKEEFGCRVSKTQLKLMQTLEAEGFLGEDESGELQYDLVEVFEFESRSARALRHKGLIDLYTRDPDQPEGMYGEARLKPATGRAVRRINTAEGAE